MEGPICKRTFHTYLRKTSSPTLPIVVHEGDNGGYCRTFFVTPLTPYAILMPTCYFTLPDVIPSYIRLRVGSLWEVPKALNQRYVLTKGCVKSIIFLSDQTNFVSTEQKIIVNNRTVATFLSVSVTHSIQL